MMLMCIEANSLISVLRVDELANAREQFRILLTPEKSDLLGCGIH